MIPRDTELHLVDKHHSHYYYQLKAEFAGLAKPKVPPSKPRFWGANTVKPSEERHLSSAANLEAVATKAGLTPGGGLPTKTSSTSQNAPPTTSTTKRSPRRRLVLSQTMIIHVDPQNRSKDAETVILHHDVIQNPGTAFHFELNWVGTTAKFIDELLQSWSHSVEKYGLRLVEAYVDPITDVAEKSVFHSTYPIRLAVAPPSIPDLQRRLPHGTQAEQYFEYAILRHFDYILDIEAGSKYSESVDVCYSYRRSSFGHSQFVHRSGLAFCVVVGGAEGFRWMTNRLAGTSNNFGWQGGGGGAQPGRGGGGGGGNVPPGGGGRGKTSANSSIAPSMSTGGGGGGNPGPIGGGGGGERERVATSVLIQKHLRALSEFCSDAGKLQTFYAQTLAALPQAPPALEILVEDLSV